jgi:hypothetical protein
MTERILDQFDDFDDSKPSPLDRHHEDNPKSAETIRKKRSRLRGAQALSLFFRRPKVTLATKA